MSKAENFFHSSFDSNSKRSSDGLGFQKKILEELKLEGATAVTVSEWLLSLDPHLTDRQVWKLEKTWGDIVCKRKSGSNIFIECVTSAGDTTPFPTSKIGNFQGGNKWYLFGWDEERHFVPSIQWNVYANKIDKRAQRESDVVVIVSRSQYSSMRCGIKGLKQFCEENELI